MERSSDPNKDVSIIIPSYLLNELMSIFSQWLPYLNESQISREK